MDSRRKYSARIDKFGNPYELVSCKDKKGDGFSKGFVELKGQLYKIEPSMSSKGKVDKYGNPVLYWVKITKMAARQNVSL